MTEPLLPLRSPPDQPLERYVQLNLARLNELADEGFSHRALAFLMRRVGFASASPRTVGSAMDRARRHGRGSDRSDTSPSAASPTNQQTSELGEEALRDLGSKRW